MQVVIKCLVDFISLTYRYSRFLEIGYHYCVLRPLHKKVSKEGRLKYVYKYQKEIKVTENIKDGKVNLVLYVECRQRTVRIFSDITFKIYIDLDWYESLRFVEL